MASPFDSAELQLELLAMVVWDKSWLRSVGGLIEKEDFQPIGQGNGMAWTVANLALDFYHRHHTPIGSLMPLELDKWAKSVNVGDDRKSRLTAFLTRLKKYYDPSRSAPLQEQILDFKKNRAKLIALRTMTEAFQNGELTDEVWMECTRQALDTVSNGSHKLASFTDTLDERMFRRSTSLYHRRPILMIDPIDTLIRSIGRGHLGLWVGHYKMGKSLALMWVASSYLYQGLNVLFFTLEDTMEDVEDRFDASITQMPIVDLNIQGPEVERRMTRFKKQCRSQLRVVDGTDGTITIRKVEAIWEREREAGFEADVVILDYDDEIKPVVKRDQRRQEFADIYRDFRSFLARRHLIGWTAAQTIREAEGQKVITGKMIAEDISKIRKVTMAIGIGQGDWGPESRYLNIMAHRLDIMRTGVHIWSAPEKAVFYDRERTLRDWLSDDNASQTI